MSLRVLGLGSETWPCHNVTRQPHPEHTARNWHLWWVEKWSPKDVHIQNLWVYYLTWQRAIADVVRLRILRWAGWAQCNHNRKEGGRRVREGDWQQKERARWGDNWFWRWKWATRQGMQTAYRCWKRQGKDLPCLVDIKLYSKATRIWQYGNGIGLLDWQKTLEQNKESRTISQCI